MTTDLLSSHPLTTFLRDQRLRRALTPYDVAERIGVHPTSVLRWERGERLPGPAHITGLARTLEVDTAVVTAYFDRLRRPEEVTTVRGLGLRPLRLRAGLPASRIAESVGVPAATVYNWESGRARVPLDHLPGLARALRLEVDALRELLTRPVPAFLPAPVPPLRRLRHRVGLSQAEVAVRVGVSRRIVGRWERGSRPPLSALRRLALVYGVAVTEVARAAGVQPPAELDPRRWAPGDLPAVLRVLREWSGLTQREVAERCGCSVDATRAWERGRGLPRPESLRRLEAAYGLVPGALVSALPQGSRAALRARPGPTAGPASVPVAAH